jgi:hypothetical protein
MGGLIGLLAVLAFLVLAAVIVTRRVPERSAEAPAPSPEAPVTTVAAAPSDPPPSEEPSPEALPASPEPEATPPAPAAPGKAPRAARRAAAPADGGARVADAAVPPAVAPGIQLPPGSAPRRFVLGTTSIESLKPVERNIKGFEAGGVGVKRAPEVNGRVELEMNPPHVRPGVDYIVKVYLANDGDKDIPVQDVQVKIQDDARSSSKTAPPRARNVKPRQRALLHEIEGVWRESSRSWAMDVVVTSSRQDVYRNRLRWE